MKIWVATFLLFSGVIQYSKGQDDPDNDFEAFRDFNGPPSESYFPELFDVSESAYLAEDDGDGRRSFKVVDAKPRLTRSFLYVASPKDSIIRNKRKTPEDYDYTKSYRDFVRDNFGLDDARAFADEDDGNVSEDSEYERIKELSDRQTEESKKNPDFCKVIHKDGKECTICKNPKTNAQSETCSYSSKPKPKKYAYKRERNYNSKDDEDDDDGTDHDEEASQKEERRSPKQKQRKPRKQAPARKNSRYEEEQEEEEIQPKAKSNRRNKPKKQVPRQADEYYGDQAFRPSQPYTTTAVGRKVDQVLEEFKKRDWSKCKRKSKKGLTCYYCKDAKGASHEECMYISDDSPEADTYQKDVEDYDETLKEVQKITTRSPQRQTQSATQRSHPQRQNQSATQRVQHVAPPEPQDSEGNPTEKRTIKRMVSVKIHENGDSDPAANKEVFYKKIVQVDRK